MAREKMHIDDSLRDQKLSKVEIKRPAVRKKLVIEFTMKPKWQIERFFTSNKETAHQTQEKNQLESRGDIWLWCSLCLCLQRHPLVYTIFAAFKPLNELHLSAAFICAESDF